MTRASLPISWTTACAAASLLLPLAGGDASAQAYPHDERTDRVDALFEDWDRPDSPGAALGIIKDGRIIYARGYGSANLDWRIPMTPQTVLRIGSITKQFVAVCVALLEEQGKLDLDDDIRAYLPEFPDYGKPITIRHLLHHTSGIREYLSLVELVGKPEGSGYVYTPRELVAMLARQRNLDFPTGERYSYSNSGYFLAAEIVARVSGTPASEFMRKHVFEPLGMDDSRLHDDPHAIIRNRGFGYSKKDDGSYRLDILRLRVVGDLGVLTNVEDFLRWDRNFYDNQLGKGGPELIETMLTPGEHADEGDGYGLGLSLGHYRGLRTIGHGGSAVGYVAQYTQYPDHRFSVVVLANSSSFRPGRIARQIADIYLAEQFTEPAPSLERDRDRSRRERPETISLTVAELEPYAGDYHSEELDIVYPMTIVDGALVMELREVVYEVTPRSDGTFGLMGGSLRFDAAQGGAITGFTLDARGLKGLHFERIERRPPGG